MSSEDPVAHLVLQAVDSLGQGPHGWRQILHAVTQLDPTVGDGMVARALARLQNGGILVVRSGEWWRADDPEARAPHTTGEADGVEKTEGSGCRKCGKPMAADVPKKGFYARLCGTCREQTARTIGARWTKRKGSEKKRPAMAPPIAAVPATAGTSGGATVTLANTSPPPSIVDLHATLTYLRHQREALNRAIAALEALVDSGHGDGVISWR